MDRIVGVGLFFLGIYKIRFYHKAYPREIFHAGLLIFPPLIDWCVAGFLLTPADSMAHDFLGGLFVVLELVWFILIFYKAEIMRWKA